MTTEPKTHECVDDWHFLRSEVQAFATAMEHQLRLNDYKGGWEGTTLNYLSRRLTMELKELRRTMKEKLRDNPAVVSEAADVANFAMMIADNSHALNWMQKHARCHERMGGIRNDECSKHS